MLRAVSSALLLATVVLACSGDGEATAPPLEALNGGTSMRDTPWPSDVFRKDGHLDVKDVPLEGKPEAIAALAASLSELDGAPSFGSVFFPVAGDFANGPLEGRAHFVDLDAPNARAIESTLFYRSAMNELVALAPRGNILTQGHRYAVLVESPKVHASSAMQKTIDDPALAAHVAGRKVVAATIFTVGRPTVMVDAMRAVAEARPLPHAKVERIVRGAEALDELLGKPTTTRPGLGDPAGVVHDRIDAIVLGTFDAPSFLSATPPKLGRIESDGAGKPIVKGTEPIPFMLALPKDVNVANVPLLIFQHGLNASRTQVATVANDYARAGFATIGVDALFHGNRALSPKDVVHDFGGAPAPDGLADADDFGASVQIFDFGGDPAQSIAAFDGRIVRDNFRQAICDLGELVRFIKKGDLSAIRAADASLAELSFDSSALVYTGESFGSVIGASALATADVEAGVLSVGGGGIFLPTFARSPLFAGMVTPFLRTSFDANVDVSDPAVLPAEAQRSLSLVQAAIAGGDPLSFAPLLPERKKHMLLLTARSDELIPNESSELLAIAAGATAVTLPERSEPPRYAPLAVTSAPYSGRDAPTIAMVQLTSALHVMFTAFEGERRYEPDFPPFIALPAPQKVDNPIELAHDLTIEFARSFRTGKPRVAVP